MNEATPESVVLAVAVLFARVGGVFLIAPGLSSMRVPVQVKVFLALGVTLALTPLLLERTLGTIEDAAPGELLRVLGTETLIGLLIGLLTRLMVMALQTLSVAIANAIGLGGIPGGSLDEGTQTQAAATLFTLTAVTIIMLSDLHYEILRALVGSYEVVPPGSGLDTQAALDAVTNRFSESFLVALRLAAPFLIYSVVVNFAVGITNKLAPAIPVFFVALPFVTVGGLIILSMAIREVMLAFLDAFQQLTGAL